MITKEKNRTKIICAVVTAISAIVAGGSAFQLYNVQNISQTVNGNVIQILGETGSYVSAGTDLTDSTDELISAYRKVLDENSQYQANQSTLQGQVQSLQNENDDLKNQIQILKGTLLNTYSSDEINSVIEQGGLKRDICNGVQREHNKKLNNGLPILHKVPPKRDYGRYFCIMAEKGGTSHGGLTEKLSLFFHAKKQEVNAYGR